MGYLETLSSTIHIIEAVKQLQKLFRNDFYETHLNQIMEENYFITVKELGLA